jgi:putative phosphoesterase
MNIAVLSDVHGNQVALEAVLADIHQQPDIDQIVFAGDLCLNGPRPREVLETIQGLHCPVVQGNVDNDVVNLNEKRSPRKQAIIEWTRKQIGAQNIRYLERLPQQHLVKNPGGTDLLVVHANPRNQHDAILPTSPDDALHSLLDDVPANVGAIAFGHHHIAFTRRWRNLLLVDTGSCGLPRDEDIRAAYAIISWHDGQWQAQHRRVHYDQQKVVTQLETCGMPSVERRIKILMEARY